MVMLLDQWRMGAPSPLKDRSPGLKLCGDGAAQTRQAFVRPFMKEKAR